MFDGFRVGPGMVLTYTLVRTVIAIGLSIQSHRRGAGGPSLALQTLSDGILAIGALLYAEGKMVVDVPRVLMATLIVYAVAWETYAGLWRAGGALAEKGVTFEHSPVDDFTTFLQGFGWLFLTAMLVFFSGSVVASRPDMTDAQKLAPIVGVSVPIIAGFGIAGYVGWRHQRDEDGWTPADSIALLLAGLALAYGVWAWL